MPAETLPNTESKRSPGRPPALTPAQQVLLVGYVGAHR
jgi:hypothetical protein